MQRAVVGVLSLVVLAGMLVTPRARAQSVEVSKVLHRKQPERPGSQRPRWLNLADCLARDVFTFSVSLRDYDGYALQAWAGDRGVDCGSKDNRKTGSDSECWLVFSAEADAPTISVDVSAVDLVAREAPTKRGAEARVVHGSTDVCTDSSVDNGVPLGLHFMLVDSAGTVAGDPDVWTDIGYDVVPPAAPTRVTASAGETRLFVDWTAAHENDVRSYVFYCDAAAAAVYDAGRHTPIRTQSRAETFDEGGAAINDAGATTSPEAEVTTHDAGPQADDADGGSAGTCAPWSDLRPGTSPQSPRSLARYVCGSTGPNERSAQIDHLTNDVEYVVAVAAVDDTGNVGPLSSQACQTPVEITDFFELYKKAGGSAGGGICSIARPASTPGGASHSVAAGFALAGVAVRRAFRRRDRRRA